MPHPTLTLVPFDPSVRVCIKCGHRREADEFEPHRKKCLVCRREESRVAGAANYAANRESRKAKGRSDYAANPRKFLDRIKKSTEKRSNNHPKMILLTSARARAKKLGLEFDITHEDLRIPEFCPYLNVRMVRGQRGDYSSTAPSVDRIDSSKGYVRDNVMVISRRANTLKNNSTIAELTLVIEGMKKFGAP